MMSYKEIIAEMEDALRERGERISQLMYRIEAQQKELYAWQDSAARERMLETVPIYINSDDPGVSDVIAQSYSNLLVSNVKLGKQIAALEASNHDLRVKVAELQAQLEQCEVKHTKSHEEAADWRRMHGELLTELGPWRRMGGQLNALFNADYAVNMEVEMGGFCVATWPNSPEIVDPATMIEVSGVTLPAAVAAAYEQVMGAGE